MNLLQNLSEKIKKLSKEHNKSINTVLSECNLNRNFIYDLERRGSFPSIDKIYTIAEYFNTSLDFLVGLSDNPNPSNGLSDDEKLIIDAFRENNDFQKIVTGALNYIMSAE